MRSSSRWSPVATAILSSGTRSVSTRCRFNASTVTSRSFGCAWNRATGRIWPGSAFAASASEARAATAPLTAPCQLSCSWRTIGSFIISSRFNSLAPTL